MSSMGSHNDMRERHPAARQAGLGAEDAAATSSRGSNSVDAAGGDGGSAPPPRRPRVSPLCLGVLVVLCSAVSVGMALWGYHALLRVTTPRVQDARRVPLWEFPSRVRLEQLKTSRMRASTSFALPTSGGRDRLVHIGSVMHTRTWTNSRSHMPEMLYNGVLYWVSAWNAQDTQRALSDNRAANDDLYEAILRMRPAPSAVYPSVHEDEETGTVEEEGFVLHFSQPSSETERAVLILARIYGQVSVMKWWPHVWGVNPDEHVTVMQSIVPVASAVQGIQSDGVAQLVEVERRHVAWLHEWRGAHGEVKQEDL